MQEINARSLENVAGGSRKSDLINTTLTQMQSQIKDLASANNNNSATSPMTMLMLCLALKNNNQPTVVAGAPATTVVAAQPAFSFRARIRF